MKKVIYLLACVAFLGCYSCSDDDDGLKMQDISVEFGCYRTDDFYGGIRVGYYRYPGSD